MWLFLLWPLHWLQAPWEPSHFGESIHPTLSRVKGYPQGHLGLIWNHFQHILPSRNPGPRLLAEPSSLFRGGGSFLNFEVGCHILAQTVTTLWPQPPWALGFRWGHHAGLQNHLSLPLSFYSNWATACPERRKQIILFVEKRLDFPGQYLRTRGHGTKRMFNG